MSELTLEKETTKLEKFLKKEGRQDFIDEMRSADAGQLEARLLGLAKHAQEITNTRDNDDELRRAKERAKDLGATYRDQKKMNDKLARFVALMMQDKGIIAETAESQIEE